MPELRPYFLAAETIKSGCVFKGRKEGKEGRKRDPRIDCQVFSCRPWIPKIIFSLSQALPSGHLTIWPPPTLLTSPTPHSSPPHSLQDYLLFAFPFLVRLSGSYLCFNPSLMCTFFVKIFQDFFGSLGCLFKTARIYCLKHPCSKPTQTLFHCLCICLALLVNSCVVPRIWVSLSK